MLRSAFYNFALESGGNLNIKMTLPKVRVLATKTIAKFPFRFFLISRLKDALKHSLNESI